MLLLNNNRLRKCLFSLNIAIQNEYDEKQKFLISKIKLLFIRVGEILMKRSIILFPELEQLNLIQGIRDKYDPLATLIAPHITLVFPFESDISNYELERHLKESLEGIKKFRVELKGITGDLEDGYIFLNVKKGNDQIIELHDKLYSGVLEKYLFRKVNYIPHITVGRVEDKVAFNHTIDELEDFKMSFNTEIKKVYVEMISDNDKSIILFSHDLG